MYLNQYGFTCGVYSNYCHFVCSDYDDEALFLALQKYESRIAVTHADCEFLDLSWMLSTMKSFESKVGDFTLKLNNLLGDKIPLGRHNSVYKQGSATSFVDKGMLQSGIASQIREAIREQTEFNITKRSFVINDLDENLSTDVDPVLADNIPLLSADIEAFSYIGSANKEINKPRPVRVTLHQSHRRLRNDIKRAAPKLRKSIDPRMKKVFINPDKTRYEQKQYYNLCNELRR